MKKITYLLFLLIGLHSFGQGVPIITMIADGDETGGVPKVVEIYAKGTVDFSNYTFEKSVNGGAWSDSFDLSVIGIKTDEFIYIYKDADLNGVSAFDANFPSVPASNKFSTNSDALNFNGDDPVRIIETASSTIIDIYGEDGTDGTGTVWEYKDGYAKRLNGTGPDGATFVTANWEFHKGELNTHGAIQDGTTYESIIGIGTYVPSSATTPTQLLVSADPVVTWDGQTTLTITATDDNGAPVNVAADVTVNISVNTTGNFSPSSAVIAAGTSSVSIVVTYDSFEVVTFTVTGDVNADGTDETASVDVEFKEALINTFPYTKDFEDGSLVSDGWNTSSTNNINWIVSTIDNNTFAKFSNYDGGNRTATTAYYISPRVDASSLNEPAMLFDYASSYDADQVPLKVYSSTDYSGDPATATWNEIWSSTDKTSFDWRSSGVLDLAITDWSNVHFAFVVDAPDGLSPTWEIDNIFIGEKSSVAPAISITSPADGTVFDPETTTVTISLSVINFAVADPQAGTGDGYIIYEFDNDAAVNKYDTDDIVLDNLTPGVHHILVQLVDNNGTPLDPVVSAEITFTIKAYIEVANLTELRAGTIGEYYSVTGEVFVIGGQQTSWGALQGFVVDFSGANNSQAGIMVYDNNSIITINPNDYDGIIDMKGQLGEYNGTLQLLPTADATLTGNNHPVTPQEITADELNTNHENYESELIKIANATIDPAGDTNFAVSKNYDLTDASGTTILRTYFTAIDGEPIPTGTVNVTGIGGEYKGTAQIYPRDSADIEEQSSAVTKNNIKGLHVYPNPVQNGNLFISSDNSSDKAVYIYSITGKQVFNGEVENGESINISNLKSGVYLIKVIENDKIAVQKLMIK